MSENVEKEQVLRNTCGRRIAKAGQEMSRWGDERSQEESCWFDGEGSSFAELARSSHVPEVQPLSHPYFLFWPSMPVIDL